VNALDALFAQTFAPLGMIQAGVIVVLIAATAWLLWRFVVRSDRRDAEALQRLAHKRGWTIRRHMETGGTGYRIEVSPRDRDERWTCTVRRWRNTRVTATVRTTEFTSDVARTHAGMVVVGPGIPRRDADEAARMLGNLDGTLALWLLARIFGEEDADAHASLRPVRGVELPGATVFATPDADARAVTDPLAGLLAEWNTQDEDMEQFPVALIVDATGLRMRVRTDLARAADLEAFIDRARAVCRELARSD